jgi:hypothetical protein
VIIHRTIILQQTENRKLAQEHNDKPDHASISNSVVEPSQSKNINSSKNLLGKENFTKNLQYQTQEQVKTKNPFQAGRSLQRTPPNSSLKTQPPSIDTSRPNFGEACINLGENLDSESNETEIPKKSSTSRPKIVTADVPSQPLPFPRKMQGTQIVVPLKSSSRAPEEEEPKTVQASNSSASEMEVIELQLKLSNELLEKYQLQEEMIRLRQQMRAQQVQSIDSNLTHQLKQQQQEAEEEEMRRKQQQLQQQQQKQQREKEQMLEQQQQLEKQQRRRQEEEELQEQKQKQKTQQEDMSNSSSPALQFQSEESQEFFESNHTEPLRALTSASHPASPPQAKAKAKAKKATKKISSPEVYVDLGAEVPYLVPKGMTFQPLRSKISNRLVGHVPKSPPHPREAAEAEEVPKVKAKVTEGKKKEPVKRKKVLLSSPVPKESKKPVESTTPSSKSPPFKQSKKASAAVTGGYGLFCEHIREDAIKILEAKVAPGVKGGEGKGKKKQEKEKELDELMEKMWSVLSKAEKAQWEKGEGAGADEEEEEEELVAPVRSEDLFASTTRSSKTKSSKSKVNRGGAVGGKTSVTVGRSRKEKTEETHAQLQQPQEDQEEEELQQQQQKGGGRMRKKRVIPDPSEELFDRVENTSTPSSLSRLVSSLAFPL